jgi:hypothetical protein
MIGLVCRLLLSDIYDVDAVMGSNSPISSMNPMSFLDLARTTIVPSIANLDINMPGEYARDAEILNPGASVSKNCSEAKTHGRTL